MTVGPALAFPRYSRLLADAIKPDPALALGLSSIQWVCLAGLAYYAWVLRGRVVGR